MSSLPEEIDRQIRAGLNAALDDLAASVQSATDGMQAEIAYVLPPVQKIGTVVQLSNELAMEYGLIPDTRPPVVITRRDRFRWWRQDKTRRLRLRVGEWVAGQRFSEED